MWGMYCIYMGGVRFKKGMILGVYEIFFDWFRLGKGGGYGFWGGGFFFGGSGEEI